jgi:hypothetical protein
MKKAYLNPTIEFDSMDCAELMNTASLEEKNGIITTDLSKAADTDATSGNLSRRNSLWEDDEAEY